MGHSGAHLEVFCEVIDSGRPGIHLDAAKPATGPGFGYVHLPRIQLPVQVCRLHIVDQSQMLTQVVLPVKSSFSSRSLLASRKIVAFDVCVVWVDLVTVDTRYCTILFGDSRPLGGAEPFLKGNMQGLLVPLPNVLRLECFSTKSALESVQGSLQGGFGIIPSLSSTGLASQSVPSWQFH